MKNRLWLVLTIVALTSTAWLLTAGAQEPMGADKPTADKPADDAPAIDAPAADAPAVEGATTAPSEKPQEPMTPEKEQDIRKLLELTGVNRMASAGSSQMLAQFQAAYPNVPAEQIEEVRKILSVDELINLLVPSYARYLTHEEIKGIITFLESPIGKRFTEVQPDLGKDTNEAAQQWSQRAAMTLMRLAEEQRRAAETKPAETQPSDGMLMPGMPPAEPAPATPAEPTPVEPAPAK